MEQSAWQRQAAQYEFDAHARELEGAKRAIIEEAAAKARAAEAPIYYDVAYDPTHPDADWSGLVRKRNIKKHVSVPSALTPAPDGNGLTTAPTARTHGGISGKKRTAPPTAGGGGGSLLAHDSGPAPQRGEGAWKTTAQLAAEGAPTPKEALGEERQRLGNRSAATTRKTLPVRPAFQEPWPPAVPLPTRGEAKQQEGGGEEDLVGYRAPPSTWGGQRGVSLLSGLGAKLREARVLKKGGGGGGV